MSYLPVDRPPLWDDGLRDDVRQEWALHDGLPIETDLSGRFVFDRREEIGVELRPKATFNPLKEPKQLDRIGSYFPPHKKILEEVYRRVDELISGDRTVGLVVWRGLLQSLGTTGWKSLTEVLTGLFDRPEVAETTVRWLADSTAAVLEPILRQAPFDYIVLSEPIADNLRTIVSPAMFRRFCMPFYRKISALAKRCGVPIVILRTWGHATSILPLAIEAGINTLWCGDSGVAGVDYVSLRRQYGTALFAGKAEIDRALLKIVPPLIADGGYVPLADGRIRREVSFPAYRYYRHRLQELCGL